MTTDNQKDARYEKFGSDFEPTLVKPEDIEEEGKIEGFNLANIKEILKGL